MTRKEVIVKAIAGDLTWIQAAAILGITPRHLRRLKRSWERREYDGLQDQRGRTTRRRRIPVPTIATLCRLRRERYADFSIQHFWERATAQHGLALSYTWTRLVLQAAGLAPKAPGRGKYRRKRERRPLVGMLIHLDASTHAWLPDQPAQDLVVRWTTPTAASSTPASGPKKAPPRRSTPSTTSSRTRAASPNSTPTGAATSVRVKCPRP